MLLFAIVITLFLLANAQCHTMTFTSQSLLHGWIPKLLENWMVKSAAESNKRSADDNVNVNVTQQGQGGDLSSNAEGGSTQTTRASSNKKQKRASPVTDDSLCP